MKRDKWFLLILFIFLLAAHGFVGNMDRKMQLQEEAWKNSVQAVELQQQEAELRVIELKDQLKAAEEQVIAQGLLIYDIRERLNFTLFEDAEMGLLE